MNTVVCPRCLGKPWPTHMSTRKCPVCKGSGTISAPVSTVPTTEALVQAANEMREVEKGIPFMHVSPESNPQGEPPVDNSICMGTRDCPCPDCRPVVIPVNEKASMKSETSFHPSHETDQPDASADGPLEPEKFQSFVTPKHREVAHILREHKFPYSSLIGIALNDEQMAKFLATHFPAHDPVKERLADALKLIAWYYTEFNPEDSMPADWPKDESGKTVPPHYVVMEALAAYEAERKS